MVQFQSFEEFWPFYVKEHINKKTRTLHFVGTTAAMACVAGSVLLRKKWLLAVAPVVGYTPSWIGHFFIEKNRPATFKYPLWSLRADLVMWTKIARGTMDAEVERVLAMDRTKTESAQNEGTDAAPSGPSPVAATEAVN
jgi:hypothetical protein